MGAYKQITIPAGKRFNNAIVKWSVVVFNDKKDNPYDSGMREAKFDEIQITKVVDRSKEDTISPARTINGFSVKLGTIVDIVLTKTVTDSVQTEEIIYTQRPTLSDTNKPTTDKYKQQFFTPTNIAIIGAVCIALVFLVLNHKKIL